MIGRARHTASSLAPARLACPTHSQVRPTHACNPTHTPPNMCMCNGASLKPETEADPSLSVGAAALAVN